MANGRGKLWLNNGDIYEGDMFGNVIQGNGVYYCNRGPIYSG